MLSVPNCTTEVRLQKTAHETDPQIKPDGCANRSRFRNPGTKAASLSFYLCDRCDRCVKGSRHWSQICAILAIKWKPGFTGTFLN